MVHFIDPKLQKTILPIGNFSIQFYCKNRFTMKCEYHVHVHRFEMGEQKNLE